MDIQEITIQKKHLTVDDLTEEIVAVASTYGLVKEDAVVINAAMYDTSVTEEIVKQINQGLEGPQMILGLF
jgi:hypothetical protein